MAGKKKLLTAAIALGTAAALTLGGTFAWQSISQTALNESSDIVNPGGRLHSDMQYTNAKVNNSDIYVENFTDPDKGGETIFARVRLEEYMEIVMNYGLEDLETVEVVTGEKKLKEGAKASDVGDATRKDLYDYTYTVHKFDAENDTDAYWKLNGGTEDSETVYYMPTFNKNKDSLVADINGNYSDAVGGISNRGESQYDYKTYTADSTKTANEIYDGDVDTLDELQDKAIVADLITDGEGSSYYPTYKDDVTIVENVEHKAAKVGTTQGLVPMEEWLEQVEDDGGYDEETHGACWVYDTDGWVYWSSPIEAGECTGLLLDSFELTQVMDDTWYYAINVVGQFCTAGDLGTAGTTNADGTSTEGTGFYMDGETISDDAKELLDFIGATGAEAKDDDGEDDDGEDDAVTTVSEVIALNDESGDAYTYTVTPDSTENSESRAKKWTMTAAAPEDYTLDLNNGTYTITKDGASIGTFDKNTGVLTVNGDANLLGLTVTATKGDSAKKYEFYITHGDTIYALVGNVVEWEGNDFYDVVIFTSTDNEDELTTAAQAAFTGIAADQIQSCKAIPDTYESVADVKKIYDPNYVRSLRFANKVQPTNMDYWFAYCGYVDYMSEGLSLDITNLDTSKVTSMKYTFYTMRHAVDLSKLDTSNVTDMRYMFAYYGRSAGNLDFSGLDTSSVTNMSYMFYECELRTMDLNTFDTSNVTDMSGMFSWADVTTLKADKWDTSKVETMQDMFSYTYFPGMDFSGWDTSSVTTMNRMFYKNYASQLDITGLSTAGVSDLSSMFDCAATTTLDVSGLDTSSATTLKSMFSGMPNLTELDLSTFDTSKVTTMKQMFCDSYSIQKLNFEGFDTSKVTDMHGMFKSCRGLTELDVSMFDTSSVTNMYEMFHDCSGLTQLDISNFNTANVTDMSNMFKDDSKLETLTLGDNFKTANVTRMSAIFTNCSNLTLDCSGWDITSVTDHYGWYFSENADGVTPPTNW